MKFDITPEYLSTKNVIVNNRALRAMEIMELIDSFMEIVEYPVEILEQMQTAWDHDTHTPKEVEDLKKQDPDIDPEFISASISKRLGWIIETKHQYLDARSKNWKTDKEGHAI